MKVKASDVWAPAARQMELITPHRSYPMHPGGGGWWRADCQLDHGDDYTFRVNGEGPFPDPRSPWQPAGVHGPSRHFDHARFSWDDHGWQPPPLATAVLYELHIGTFTPEGTFIGAISKLDHLVELGVTHLQLMPVHQFPGIRGWGYDGVDLFAPQQSYGGPAGLKQLVDACHQRGLAVVLDVVYNHLGPEGNYLRKFAPYFTDHYRTAWGDAINLDGPDSDEVRTFLIDNALMWLRDYHCDGLRLDAIHAIVDTSAVHFLEQLADAIARLQADLGRPLALLAESDRNDPRPVWPRSRGGYGLDALYNEDFHHALHAAMTGERHGYYQDFGSLGDLAEVLSRGLTYSGRYSRYRRRHHGRSAAGVGGGQWVACLQNHDQVGNRPAGERSGTLLDRARLMLGAAATLTSPFIPMLFQGEEWGASSPFTYFTDYEDPELGRAVRAGRKRDLAAIGYRDADIADPLSEQTFLAAKLDWSERAFDEHAEILSWHRRLIELRHRLKQLGTAFPSEVEATWDDQQRWLAITRSPFVVALNFSHQRRSLPLPVNGTSRLLAASAEAVAVTADRIELPASAAAILEFRMQKQNHRRKRPENTGRA